MLVKNAENRGQLEFVSLETMVPQDHLLRKIEAAIDFKKIYEFVEGLYCEDNGRPSIDPVALFKIVLIQHIYGIPSLRRTLEEVSMNLAYRWFIGYPLTEAVPHFSTVSYNFKHRFNHATVEYVFRWVLKAAAEEGYLDTEAIFVDGTHIKASANLKKQAKKAVSKQAKRYAKELFNEVNKEREEHGKKPFSDDSDKKPPQERETKETVVSTTDPESGVFHKGEHKKCFAYEAHTACDNHNFVLGVHVTPGNIHDSVAFDPLYDELCRDYPEHKIVVADSAYKTPWICKRIFESGRILSTCYTRPKTKENGHPWWAYVYDEYFDDVICPEYRALHYSTTNRDGYREYKSRAYLCKTCPTRRMCTENARCEKTVLRHVWQDYVEMAEHVRHMAVYRELYRLRKEKIERVFADAKEKHGMRYTQYRGLAQVTNWVKLKFAAMNLKKIATWKWNARHPAPDGGKRTRTEENLAAVSLLFPFSFLLTNKKIALA
jgi:transposase